jgi:hypothetical protein
MAKPASGVSLKTPTAAPTQKVTAGGVAGAVSFIVIAVLQHYLNRPIDATTASIITAAVSFLVAYVVPPSARDVPVQAPP